MSPAVGSAGRPSPRGFAPSGAHGCAPANGQRAKALPLDQGGITRRRYDAAWLVAGEKLSLREKRAFASDPNVLAELEPRLEGMARALCRKMQKSLVKAEEKGANRAKLLLRMGWYESRIQGLLTLVSRVETCGEVERVFACQAAGCGHKWTAPEWCDQPLLCRICRAIDLKKRRGRMGDDLAVAERGGEECPACRRIWPWGQAKPCLCDARPRFTGAVPKHWRRRFVTLTVPHEGGLEDRIRWACVGRARFFRRLRDWMREQGEDPPVWWTALETTGGNDRLGHVHQHAIVLSPWISDVAVGVLWGRELERLGCPVLERELGPRLDRLLAVSWRKAADPAVSLVLREARIPWTVAGQSAPGRRKGEGALDYLERRAVWASLARDSVEVRRRKIVDVLGSFARHGDETAIFERFIRGPGVAHRLGRIATVPHAIVDVRVSRADSDVFELVKYLVKDWDTPELQARFVACLKENGWRRFQSSIGVRRPAAGEGCPSCGSCDIRVEKQNDVDEDERFLRLGHYLGKVADVRSILDRLGVQARAP